MSANSSVTNLLHDLDDVGDVEVLCKGSNTLSKMIKAMKIATVPEACGEDYSCSEVPAASMPGAEVSGIAIPGTDISGIAIPGPDISRIAIPGPDISRIAIPGLDISGAPSPGKENLDIPKPGASNLITSELGSSRIVIPGPDPDIDIPGPDPGIPLIDISEPDIPLIDISEPDIPLTDISEPDILCIENPNSNESSTGHFWRHFKSNVVVPSVREDVNPKEETLSDKTESKHAGDGTQTTTGDVMPRNVETRNVESDPAFPEHLTRPNSILVEPVSPSKILTSLKRLFSKEDMTLDLNSGSANSALGCQDAGRSESQLAVNSSDAESQFPAKENVDDVSLENGKVQATEASVTDPLSGADTDSHAQQVTEVSVTDPLSGADTHSHVQQEKIQQKVVNVSTSTSLWASAMNLS